MSSTKLVLLIGCIINIYISSMKIESFVENHEKDDDVTLMISSDLTVDIYTLDSTYTDVLKIPSTKKKFYQVDSGPLGKYRVTSGNSVTVATDGTIYPRNTTWYWYGGMGYSYPLTGKEPTRIQVSYTLGTSVVTVTIGTKQYKVTVNVKDYASEYVEAKVDAYIKANVTTKSTNLEKLKAITAYPAMFPYSPKYQSYTSMIIFEGGDCWASSNTIKYLCDKVGITSHVRFAANDVGSGSGHRNVIAEIDGKYYICEAGYYSTKPNRGYNVKEEPLGYSTKSTTNGLIIYQYDGSDQQITVPSTINNKTVIKLENLVFYNGPGKTATSITLPSTITSLGNSVFNSLPNLKQITIPKNVQTIGLYVFAGSDNLAKILVNTNNKYLASKNDILYNKNLTTIINYPPGKVEEKYEGLSTLERFENYSFYYTKQVKAVVVPKNVKYIGEAAFARSNIKEVYFAGEPPTLGEYIFGDLNVTVYYPKTSTKWKQYLGEKYNAKEIRWQTWTPSTAVLLQTQTTSLNITLICGLSIVFLIIVGILIFKCLRKRKQENIDFINFDINKELNKV